MAYLMAVDSGNTHVKWGIHDGNTWIKQGRSNLNQDLLLQQEWKNLPRPHKIIVSNVTDIEAKNKLSKLLSYWEIKPNWVTARTYQCGVKNHYIDPPLLGSDRWAALIAAWNYQQRGCLVIDVGTAMTVDTLSDTGEFLGGIIVPGFKLMKKALTANIISLQNQEGKFSNFPNNTADAIHSGTVHALAGTVKCMSELLSITLGHIPKCIISGGSSQQLLSKLNMDASVVDNLILEGLVLIAKEDSEII
ncbi:MAG: type III pantothenate kinase [Nitrosomonadaceae bacterium]|nr:type III pantothenate kinase [Nitrosomonadaceae bacterium]|tara:strand:- start:551 stop:1294 length:744 start_codon:yes stop_codon:yes gene_type:complete